MSGFWFYAYIYQIVGLNVHHIHEYRDPAAEEMEKDFAADFYFYVSKLLRL